MQTGKVVNFQDYERNQNRPSGRQQLLERSREVAGQQLTAAVGAMLEQADDTLFDLADKAVNMNQQNLYFDAMREIRLKREDIKQAFNTNLLSLFEAARKGQRSSNAEALDTDDLTLIDEDDLEESLAVTNAVGRFSTDCRQALFALDKRMGYLLDDPDLCRHDNPLGPVNVCHAFRDACQALNAGIEVRLILFKLFEKRMAAALAETYEHTNELLSKADILPEIKSSIRKQPTRQATARQGPDSSAADSEPAGMANDIFATLQQLLLAQQGVVAAATVADSSNVAGSGQQQALAKLTELQQAEPGVLVQHLPQAVGDAPPVNVVRALQANGLINVASPIDAQTIDIVAMMFDYIMDDPAVPAAIKAEIGRLQIPVLKASLLDKRLFSKKHHPVRRLLDVIAQAGARWESDKVDELAGRVAAVVESIANTFEEDLAIFERALRDLEEFLYQQETEVAARQARINQLLQGRERMEAAKKRIKAVFLQRIGGQDVPAFVTAFLLQYWAELLLQTYLEEGEGSPTWEAHLQTVDDLLASLRPPATSRQRRDFIARLPRLLKQLKAGIRQTGMTEVQQGEFLNALADYHTAVVKPNNSGTEANAGGQVAEHEGRGAQSAADVETPFRDELLYDSAVVKSGDGIETLFEEYFHGNQTVMSMLDTDELAIEEIELIEENAAFTEEAIDENTAMNAEFATNVDTVAALKPDTWLELTDDAGKQFRMCLRWRSETSGLLTLSDRLGRVVIRKSIRGLALDIQAGRARILEQAPLFDRALNSVFGRLGAGDNLPLTT